MTEWRDVPGYPGYRASDDGRIIGRRGWVLAQWPDRRGYLRITSNAKVHRLVCLAFHGEPPSTEHEVAHWNGVKTDNRAANLRWATSAENKADSVRLGIVPRPPVCRGEAHGRSKLTADDVRAIRTDYAEGKWTVSDLAHIYGVSKSTISGILHNTTWKSVS